MQDRETLQRLRRETQKFDRWASKWMFLIAPVLLGAVGTVIPTVFPFFNVSEQLSVQTQWSIFCVLIGFSVSFQIAVRRGMIADRDLLEKKIEEMFHASENSLDLVTAYARLKKEQPNQLFEFFADETIRKAERDLRAMLQDRQITVQAVAPSEEYVRRWGKFMDTLMEQGSTFVTVTNMEIWSTTYMGNPRSTYLYKNATDSGIKIQRVFVVPSPEMLEANRSLREDLFEILERYHRRIKDARHVETKIFEARTEEEYRQHFNAGRDGDSENFGIWKIKDELEVCLIVRYRPRSGRYEITDITFRLDDDYISQKRPAFYEKFEEGRLLEDYLSDLNGWFPREDGKESASPRTPPSSPESSTESHQATSPQVLKEAAQTPPRAQASLGKRESVPWG